MLLAGRKYTRGGRRAEDFLLGQHALGTYLRPGTVSLTKYEEIYMRKCINKPWIWSPRRGEVCDDNCDASSGLCRSHQGVDSLEFTAKARSVDLTNKEGLLCTHRKEETMDNTGLYI